MKAVVVLAFAGLVAGIIGGFLGNTAWFYGGEAIACVGFLILLLHYLWKRPQSIIDLADDLIGDETPRIDPARAEQELQRKNRGTVPTPK